MAKRIANFDNRNKALDAACLAAVDSIRRMKELQDQWQSSYDVVTGSGATTYVLETEERQSSAEGRVTGDSQNTDWTACMERFTQLSKELLDSAPAVESSLETCLTSAISLVQAGRVVAKERKGEDFSPMEDYSTLRGLGDDAIARTKEMLAIVGVDVPESTQRTEQTASSGAAAQGAGSTAMDTNGDFTNST